MPALERPRKVFPGEKWAEKVQRGKWNSCTSDGSELEGHVATGADEKTNVCVLNPTIPLLGIFVQ